MRIHESIGEDGYRRVSVHQVLVPLHPKMINVDIPYYENIYTLLPDHNWVLEHVQQFGSTAGQPEELKFEQKCRYDFDVDVFPKLTSVEELRF